MSKITHSGSLNINSSFSTLLRPIFSAALQTKQKNKSIFTNFYKLIKFQIQKMTFVRFLDCILTFLGNIFFIMGGVHKVKDCSVQLFKNGEAEVSLEFKRCLSCTGNFLPPQQETSIQSTLFINPSMPEREESTEKQEHVFTTGHSFHVCVR